MSLFDWLAARPGVDLVGIRNYTSLHLVKLLWPSSVRYPHEFGGGGTGKIKRDLCVGFGDVWMIPSFRYWIGSVVVSFLAP